MKEDGMRIAVVCYGDDKISDCDVSDGSPLGEISNAVTDKKVSLIKVCSIDRLDDIVESDGVDMIVFDVNTYRELRLHRDRDCLTGLGNRMSAINYLEDCIEKFEEDGTPFCVMIYSIDYFIKINDLYGRDFGDEVIKHTACIINKSAGNSAFTARWNTRLFIAVLGNTSIDEARRKAEETVDAIRKNPIKKHGVKLSVTATVSVDCCVIGDDSDSIIDRVETKLRTGKELIKGKVY